MPDKERKVRLVKFGEQFEEGELLQGLARLEEVEPSPDPGFEPGEPWALSSELHVNHPLRRWVANRLSGHNVND